MNTINKLGAELWDELRAKYNQKVPFAVSLCESSLWLMWPPGEKMPSTEDVFRDFGEFVFNREEYHDFFIVDECDVPMQKKIVIEEMHVR